MKKYYLISTNDFTVYSCRKTLKEIIEAYYIELKEHKKQRGYFDYKDFWIFRIEYPAKTVEVDYWLDHEIYMLDKVKDELINFDDEKKYWIKQKEINYDFLYLNWKNHEQ